MAKKAKSASKASSMKSKPKAPQKAGSKAGSKTASKAGARAGVKAKGPVAKVAKKAVPNAVPKKVVKKATPSKSTSAAHSPASKPAKGSKEPSKPGMKPAVKNSAEPVPTIMMAMAELETPAETASSEVVDGGVETAEPAEKSERRKRKDELKIDRNGNLEQQWRLLFERSKGTKALPYKMSENYEARTLLQHKVLGWGYVLSSQNNRLEVLFKDGIKFLIANYKAS